MKHFFLLLILLVLTIQAIEGTAQERPNILLILSDDLGIDGTNGYMDSEVLPTTPHLDSLRAVGITFDNVWAAPVCTPTRATIMSGRYGVKTGVLGVPGDLDPSTNISVFDAISDASDNVYADALIGKWHLNRGTTDDNPALHGIDFYSGPSRGSVTDYYNWEQTEQGINSDNQNYATSAFTDKSLSWINQQTDPWFLWLAHVAPHTPIHTPPDSLFTVASTTGNFNQYIAMIEAMDHEIGRLISSMSPETRDNTTIIYIGDNGTPNNFLQNFPNRHGKNSLYQGGISVPMIIAGAGVDRKGEREEALIHSTDLYATLLEISGADLPGGIYNSLSFGHLLDGSEGATRDYNYSELQDEDNSGWTIRNQRYKLIQFDNGTRELYDLSIDPLELDNLLDRELTIDEQVIVDDLDSEVVSIRNGWSCRDHIQNGDETGIDCGITTCIPCDMTTSTADVLLSKDCIELVPNPTNSIFEIRGLLGDFHINILDTNGTIYQKLDTSSADIEVDISNLPNGLYFISIANKANGSVSMETIIKTD